MKILKGLSIITIILLTSICALSQTRKTSVFVVDFVKTNVGEQENYVKFIELNWAKARQFMKEKGIVASYRFVFVPVAKNIRWDALLITEYVNQESYNKRETVIAEYRKTKTQILVTGKSARQLSEIKLSRTFNQPISEEVWDIMLKTQNPDVETAAARIPLENYLKGLQTGDPEYMRKAFYTEGVMSSINGGKYSSSTFEHFIAGMGERPSPEELKSSKLWIESVEVTGTVAVGKTILDFPPVRFTDYMTMLKINGEWKIVNKSFHAEQKTKNN